MSDIIAEVLPQALAAGLSPLPILAVALMLATPRARATGPSFLIGWIVGTFALVGVLVLAGSGREYGQDSDPRFFTSLLTFAAGAALLAFAFEQWRSRPRGRQEPEIPGWMQAVDNFSASKSLGLGILLSTLNTKNLPIAVGVAAAILQAELSRAGNLVVVGVYTAVVAIGVATPLFVYFVMGDRAEAILGGMRTWLGRHNNVIMTVLFLIIGANLASVGWQGMF